MITNELLEEIWRIKEDLAREADYDMAKFCDQLREFTEKNPLPPRVERTPEEWRRLLDFPELPTAKVAEEEVAYGDKEE